MISVSGRYFQDKDESVVLLVGEGGRRSRGLQRRLLEVIEIGNPGARGSSEGRSILPWFDAQLLSGELSALCPLQRRHVPAGLDLAGQRVAGLAALGLRGGAHPGVSPVVGVTSPIRVDDGLGGGLRRVGEGCLEAQVLRWGRGRSLSLVWGRRGEVQEPAERLEGLTLLEDRDEHHQWSQWRYVE